MPCTDRKLVYLVRLLGLQALPLPLGGVHASQRNPVLPNATSNGSNAAAGLQAAGARAGQQLPAAGGCPLALGSLFSEAVGKICAADLKHPTPSSAAWRPHSHHSPHLPPCRQANHRGWADFFVDMFVTGARAVPLSRWGAPWVGCSSQPLPKLRLSCHGAAATCLRPNVVVSNLLLPPWRTRRRAVGMAFPAFTSSLLCIRSILLFNRAGVRDTEVRAPLDSH